MITRANYDLWFHRKYYKHFCVDNLAKHFNETLISYLFELNKITLNYKMSWTEKLVVDLIILLIIIKTIIIDIDYNEIKFIEYCYKFNRHQLNFKLDNPIIEYQHFKINNRTDWS